MRRSGSRRLAAIWILLAIAYSVPLWLYRFATIDFVFVVDPSMPEWVARLIPFVVAAMPASFLGGFTWWWLRRSRPPR